MTIDLIKLTAPEDKVSSPIKLFLMFIALFLIILLTYGNLIIKHVLIPLNLTNYDVESNNSHTPTMKGKILLATIASVLIILMYLLIFKFL